MSHELITRCYLGLTCQCLIDSINLWYWLWSGDNINYVAPLQLYRSTYIIHTHPIDSKSLISSLYFIVVRPLLRKCGSVVELEVFDPVVMADLVVSQVFVENSNVDDDAVIGTD